MQIATLWHVTLRAVQDWWKDNCLRLAASLAYYTALSLAPLLLLIVGVGGLVLDRQQVANQLTTQLEGLMGPAGRELVTSILTTTSPQGSLLATVVGLVTLFHWRHRGFRRAAGDDEPHLGGPAGPDQRSMGRDLGMAPGARLLTSYRLCARVPPPRLARDQRRPGGCHRPIPRPGAGSPQPCPGNRRLAAGTHVRLCLAL